MCLGACTSEELRVRSSVVSQASCGESRESRELRFCSRTRSGSSDTRVASPCHRWLSTGLHHDAPVSKHKKKRRKVTNDG